MTGFLRRATALLLTLATSQVMALPAAAPTPNSPPGGVPAKPMSLTALNQLEVGLWQLDVQGRAPKLMCVTDPTALVQIEHAQPGCSRFTIANEPRSSTVHYSCQRAGWGRTTVRVDTPRAAAIRTQGISHNAPFDYLVEAHRVGSCGAQSAQRQG